MKFIPIFLDYPNAVVTIKKIGGISLISFKEYNLSLYSLTHYLNMLGFYNSHDDTSFHVPSKSSVEVLRLRPKEGRNHNQGNRLGEIMGVIEKIYRKKNEEGKKKKKEEEEQQQQIRERKKEGKGKEGE
ncbi:hypothetical protein PFLG_00996 [Plasmodium falciparum RAJ116]|uniref:Uncharacterized protein n=1 Tax=Plasmodium falciparum RAJ116 TaxID=580058 RepID=A0A0L0CXE6_PLAFA|nr:hypothetical protein PFLG_00996 [Plasmodium falciparum RAJ116]